MPKISGFEPNITFNFWMRFRPKLRWKNSRDFPKPPSQNWRRHYVEVMILRPFWDPGYASALRIRGNDYHYQVDQHPILVHRSSYTTAKFRDSGNWKCYMTVIY